MEQVLGALTCASSDEAAPVVATVLAVHGSAPRPVGSKLVVCQDGSMAGAVSGGCVEGAVLDEAERVLRGAAPSIMTFDAGDDAEWEVGLPCGGRIDVRIERWNTPEQHAFVELWAAGERAALVSTRCGDRRMLVTVDGPDLGSLGNAELDDAARRQARELMWLGRSEAWDGLLIDIVAPAPRVLIFGATDISAELCRIARVVGWRPFVLDPRSRFATVDRFPGAEAVITEWPQVALAQIAPIDPATAVVVLTHDPKLDDAALELALRSVAGYVGAIGSRGTQERRLERLSALGFTSDELDRLHAPIGLDIGGVTPQATALSIMAEIVAVQHGHAGGKLVDTDGHIHESGAPTGRRTSVWDLPTAALGEWPIVM